MGARIPEKLWSLAVGLVDTHGLSRTAAVVKLDYNALKKRVARRIVDSGSDEARSVPAGFTELSPSSLPRSAVAPSALARSGECLVKYRDSSGARLRVHRRVCDAPDLVALCRNIGY
ncbi:MAG: hypothetical protein RIK87_07600 [Fuerstiella sp.]